MHFTASLPPAVFPPSSLGDDFLVQVQQIFPFDMRMNTSVLKEGFTEDDIAEGFPGLKQLLAFLAICKQLQQSTPVPCTRI